MRQVQDTLVWLGMILVVAAVVYTMPRVAKLVAARNEQGNSSVSYSKVSVSHHPAFTHRHRDRDR
jgi:hypothetical protein